MDANKTYGENLTAITQECCKQYWTGPGDSTPQKQQLYGHLLLVTISMQIRRTRHAGHCWRSRVELLSDVLQWTSSQGRAKAGRSAGTYIQQLCPDSRCCPNDLPKAMDDRKEWRERLRNIRADNVTWWWWWWWWLKSMGWHPTYSDCNSIEKLFWGWLYSISTLNGLFHAEVSLTIMVFSYLQRKIYIYNHFKKENSF